MGLSNHILSEFLEPVNCFLHPNAKKPGQNKCMSCYEALERSPAAPLPSPAPPRPAPMPSASPDDDPEVRLLVQRGNKIAAVKRVRELTGWGLKESKDYVDRL